MSLESYLKNKIPFGEACSFLVEFHKLGEDMAMTQAPPAPDVVGLMAAVVQNEFRSILAYTVYAQTLRNLSREGLAEEFQEHADEELEHAEFLLRRMAVLGGQPPLQDVPAPVPASDPVEIVNNLIQIEQESIASWTALHAAVGEDPSKYKIEEFLAVEQEHLDDMLRLLPQQAEAPPPVDAGMIPAPMAAPGVPPQKDGAGGASVKVDLKPGGEKMAASISFDPHELAAQQQEASAYNRNMMIGAFGGPLLGGGLGILSGHRDGPGLGALAGAVGGPIAAHLLSKKPRAVNFTMEHDATPTGQTKVAFISPSVHPGTEHYHSDRMLAVLRGLPSKSYTPEGALEGVVDKYGHPVEKWASAFKEASAKLAEEFPSIPGGSPDNTQLPPQQSTQQGSQLQGDPRTSAWLQNEAEGQQAQGAQAEGYYKQRFMEAQQQLETATQASEQAGQQAQQLQQQAEQNQLALTSAQSQAQQSTALAMQQVATAGDEKLQQQMQAAQMRMAFQDLRGQLMNLASQEPPTQALNDPMAQGAQSGLAAPGTQAMGGQATPSTQPQDAASSGPAGQAPDAQVQPGTPGPGGAQAPTEGSEPAEPAGKGSGATSVTVKQGSFKDHAIGAGLGAAIGGAGTAFEASGHGDGMRDSLKKKINVLEQEQGTFPQAMRLVASKALLQGSEAAQQHPVGASIMGSLAGAGIGAATEPAVRSLMESGRRLLG